MFALKTLLYTIFFVELLIALTWQYLSIHVQSVLIFTTKDFFAQDEKSTFDVMLQISLFLCEVIRLHTELVDKIKPTCVPS